MDLIVPEPGSSRGPNLRILAVVAALVLVADIPAAALVGGSTSTSPLVANQLAAAANHTLAAKTARFVTTVNVGLSLQGRNQNIVETVTGLIDFANREEEATFKATGISFQLRTVNGTIYMELPTALRPKKVTTPWISFAVPTTGASSAGGGAATDPSGSLRALIAASNGAVGGARSAGTATIGGVPTTEYALTIDPARLNQQARAAEQLILPGGPSSTLSNVTEDVWIDAAGLVRQVVTDATTVVGQSGQSTTATVSSRTDYTDFGTPVTVQVPPAGQVTGVANLGQLLP